MAIFSIYNETIYKQDVQNKDDMNLSRSKKCTEYYLKIFKCGTVWMAP